MCAKSEVVFFAFTLVFLLGYIICITSSESVMQNKDEDGEDPEGIEELLAVDEEEDARKEENGSSVMYSHADISSRAQRIVLELNNVNAQEVIHGNEFVLILGYAPWCGRSAELMPQFAEAATLLKALGSSLLMAKLDAERYPKAAAFLNIKGFPTMFFFVNGSSHGYTGGLSSEAIVIWARKKTGMPVTRISTEIEAVKFLEMHSCFVVGVFERFEGFYYEEFIKAAISENNIQFIEVSNSAIARILYPDIVFSKHFIGLVKTEPEKYTAFEGVFEVGEILDFLEHNKFPLVTVLTELNAVGIYSSPIKLQVLVFADSDTFKKLLEPLQDIARKFKRKIVFIYVDITKDDLAKPFLTLFGLEDTEDTTVTAFDSTNSLKYLLELEPTTTNIEDFCSKLVQNTLPPYFKSQAPPENKDGGVRVVVGKTFDTLVLSSPQHIFLEVHGTWCVNCGTASKQVEKLADHFKGFDSLIFARIDASANEHPKLMVDDYPFFLFYPSGSKSNPVKLSAKSNLKQLVAFIKKNLGSQKQLDKDEL